MTRHEVLQRTDRRCAFPDHPPSGCRGDEAASAWKPVVRHAGGRPSPMGIAASWSWGSRPMPVWMRPWFPVPLATTASRLFAMRWRPCMIIITRSAYHLAEQVRPVEPPPIPSNAANLTPWTKSNFLAVIWTVNRPSKRANTWMHWVLKVLGSWRNSNQKSSEI